MTRPDSRAQENSHAVRIDRGIVDVVNVAEGQTILEAALEQGVDFPHFCQAGICRTCACDLLAGEVELLPYAGFALTADERASGRILACRALPQSACTIALPDDRDRAAHPLRLLSATVIGIAFPVPDVALLRVALGAREQFFFSAGQYVNLAFAGAPPADFSLASIPGDAELEFHVRLVAGDPTCRYIAERVRPGEMALVRGPFGSAHWRANHHGPMLLAAAGTGLAPILSILRAALEADRRRAITLFVAARDADDLYARERLERLATRHAGLRIVYVTGEPLADAVARGATDIENTKAYVAGPPAAVEATVAVLRHRGLPRRDIHAEPFHR
jgi:CDP-4-dehydro-6-deoxyglucose reductase/ferredoxin-NAD(P)+ reductase (naphthalene dioxygenase ferredoxin-specific)